MGFYFTVVTKGTHRSDRKFLNKLKKYYNLDSLKALLILAFIICACSRADSQAPSIQWQKCFGGSNDDGGSHYLIPHTNYFFIPASSNSNNGDVSGNHGSSYDAWLMNIDINGNLNWQKSFGGSGIDVFANMLITDTNRLLFWGGTSSNDGDVSGNHFSGTNDAWLVETDTLGNIIRQKCFGGSSHDGFNDVKPTSDGGYILTGPTQSIDGDLSGIFNHGVSDVWVVKIDSALNIQWQKCFGGSEEDDGAQIFKTSDGGYVISGSSFSQDGDISAPFGLYDYWLIKTDSVGNKMWDKSYGGSQNEYISGCIQTSDGGYFFTGETYSNDGFITGNHGSPDGWVVKTDSTGNLEWQKCLGGMYEDDIRCGMEDIDGGFILIGNTTSNDGDVTGNHGTACLGNPCDDVWVIKLDAVGNIMWQKCFGGSYTDIGVGIIQTADSGYLFCSTVNSFDGDVTGGGYHGINDVWVVKLSPAPTGIITPYNPIMDFDASIISARDLFTLSFYADYNEHAQVQLFDITGRLLLSQLLVVTLGLNKKQLNAGRLSNGVYIVRLVSEEGVSTKKLVIQ